MPLIHDLRIQVYMNEILNVGFPDTKSAQAVSHKVKIYVNGVTNEEQYSEPSKAFEAAQRLLQQWSNTFTDLRKAQEGIEKKNKRLIIPGSGAA